jgi:hypothetical protein
MSYRIAAGLLGVGWFLVLLIPRLTREWLLADAGWNLALMVGSSLLTALVGRRLVAGGDSIGGHAWRGAILATIGTLVYLTSAAATIGVRTVTRGGGINWHDTLSLCVMGLSAAALAGYVILPYALFCQYVMHAIAARSDAR